MKLLLERVKNWIAQIKNTHFHLSTISTRIFEKKLPVSPHTMQVFDCSETQTIKNTFKNNSFTFTCWWARDASIDVAAQKLAIAFIKWEWRVVGVNGRAAIRVIVGIHEGWHRRLIRRETSQNGHQLDENTEQLWREDQLKNDATKTAEQSHTHRQQTRTRGAHRHRQTDAHLFSTWRTKVCMHWEALPQVPLSY
jgi:hypothetical protein